MNGDWEPYNMIRKCASNFRWDWGPRVATCGITGDVRLAGFVLPHRVLPKEAFMMELTATSDSDGTVPVELYRNGVSIGRREVTIRNGTGRLRLTDRISQPGASRYEARLLPDKDSLPGNNNATQWVEVEAGLTKATFSGLIMDLIATGDRKRLTTACEEWLGRLSVMIRTHAEPPPAEALTSVSADHRH